MKEKIKINDIAQKSGVSITTVSLVLNNRPGVSEKTRKKVLLICEEMGYPVNIPEVSEGPRHKTIGMIVKSEADVSPQANPFYSQVMAGIEQACRRQGVNLLYAAMPVDLNNRPTEIPTLLNNRNVDGLLMVGTFLDETIQSIRGYGLPPLVLVDGYSEYETYDRVISDNFQAAYQMVEYLITKGHRQIAMVGGDGQAYPSLRDRRNGYVRALQDHDLDGPALCEFNINLTRGFEEIKTFLSQNPHISAVFGINDQVAVDIIRVANDLGLNIPQDLSVVGYDNTYLAENVHPQLTTMHVDTVAMGQAAVQMLTFRLEHPQATRLSLVLHPNLIERSSVREIDSKARSI